MKVTLDLDKLLQKGKITREQYDSLELISREESKSHAFAILILLAAIACVIGFVGLNPEFFSSIIKSLYETIGSDGLYALAFMAAIGGGAAARSGFLVGMSSLILLSWMGGSSMYSHASYFIAIREPAPTVIVFSGLALAGLWVSDKLPWDMQRLALIFARTCLFIVNMGFWIGSLWGSQLGSGNVPAVIFSVFWAMSILAVGYWGAIEGRLFVVNLCAVFGSIHFYTQWFETLGSSPGSLLGAGLTALLITWQLREYNRRASRKPPPPPAEEQPAESSGA